MICRPAMICRRPSARVLLALLAALALAGREARAGGGGEDPAGGSAGAPPDSAAGEEQVEGEEGGGGQGAPPDTAQVDPRLLRQAGDRFKPSYSSKYDINRALKTWTQTLSFTSWAGPVDITNSTTVVIGKESTLDRDRRNRSTNFGLTYNLPSGFKLTSSLAMTRNQTVDRGRTDTSQNTEQLNMAGEYQRDLAPDFSSTFRVSAGTSRDEREDPLTSNRRSTGPHAEASANISLKRGADWTFKTSIRNSRLNSTESRTGQTTRDNNLSDEVGMTVAFKVRGFDPWNLSINRRLGRTQYPFLVTQRVDGEVVTIALQETNDNVSRDFTLSTSTSPRPRLILSGGVSYKNADVERKIDRARSQQSIDRAVNGRLGYTFGDSTRVDARYDWSRARSLYRDAAEDTTGLRTRQNGDALSRTLGLGLRRPLGKQANLDLAGGYSLQSYLFDDPALNTDDRDVLHGDLGATLGYRPMPKISSSLRFSFQHNQTIYIDESRSSTNQTQQVYSIVPTFDYKITSKVGFREEGSVILNATFFDFNDDQNRLSRTTELRSTIDARLHRKLGFSLRHGIRFLQDGSYSRGEEDGIRRFGKSSEDTSRDLSFRAEYTPLAGVQAYFKTYKRLGRTVSLKLRGGRVVETASSSEFNELEVGGRVDRTLKSGLKIAVDLRRNQNWTGAKSSVRNNYWTGSISVAQQF